MLKRSHAAKALQQNVLQVHIVENILLNILILVSGPAPNTNTDLRTEQIASLYRLVRPNKPQIICHTTSPKVEASKKSCDKEM